MPIARCLPEERTTAAKRKRSAIRTTVVAAITTARLRGSALAWAGSAGVHRPPSAGTGPPPSASKIIASVTAAPVAPGSAAGRWVEIGSARATAARPAVRRKLAATCLPAASTSRARPTTAAPAVTRVSPGSPAPRGSALVTATTTATPDCPFRSRQVGQAPAAKQARQRAARSASGARASAGRSSAAWASVAERTGVAAEPVLRRSVAQRSVHGFIKSSCRSRRRRTRRASRRSMESPLRGSKMYSRSPSSSCSSRSRSD